MRGKISLLIFIVSSTLFSTVFNFDNAEAYKTGGKYFCEAFPAHPECVGGRTNPISDSYNYWFCAYVNLPELCENKPIPEKQITLRDQDFCGKFMGSESEIKYFEDQDSPTSNQLLGKDSPYTSIKPLIIWTDKDHYNFRDKVTVYGKFDFSTFNTKKNTSEKEFIQTSEIVNGTSIHEGNIITETPVYDIDVKFNGRKVLKNIPVNENGWFVAFFHLNDRYHFSNQNNLLEVDYLLYDDVPLGGPRTHAIYHFTSGDIAKKEQGFEMWLDESSLPNKIRYGVDTEKSEKFIVLSREDLVITRMTTPEGYVVPIKSVFAIQDLSTEYSEFAEYGRGTYEIQITYGNNISKSTFEY
jgi:hypothetical protein